jgi:restriction system protein
VRALTGRRPFGCSIPTIGELWPAGSNPRLCLMLLASPGHAKPAVVHIDWQHLAGELWWLWLLVAVVAAAKLAYRLYQNRRLSRSGIYEVDAMDGKTFERYLATLFHGLGYHVEQTGHPGDFGADLVIRRDGQQIAVQAKRWTKNVGVKAVQEAVAAKAYYGADSAMVVTNRLFTPQARILGRANNVELWDRDRLVREMLAHPATGAARATS